MVDEPQWQDRTRAVRQGEELDTAALERFLKEELPALSGPLVVEQFPGGHSNLTYLLRMGERELVLRRPPFGARNIKAGHDMEREYRILARLHPVYPRVPRPLVCSPEQGSPLGVPFYVMDRVRGVILRGRQPAGLTLGEADFRRLSEAFVDNLVELHAVDWRAAGLGELGKPEGYLGRQVKGWTERYGRAKTDELPELEAVAKWLAEHLPPDTGAGATVIHNDYKYDNMVLDPKDVSRILAVLDWEMATVGDPLSDLGMALSYWIEPGDPQELRSLGIGLTTQPGNLSREEVVARYGQKSGRPVDNIHFFFVLGLFKVAVIVQQIYFRYKQGYTQDERFAGFIVMVNVLGRMAARAIETGGVKPPKGL